MVKSKDPDRAKLYQAWPPRDALGDSPTPPSLDGKLQKVRAVIRWRTARSQLFGSKLFEEPAWDILLYSYAARLEQSEMRIGDLARILALPSSTIERWVRVLEQESLADRRTSGGSHDAAVFLTDTGLGGMHALFEVLPAQSAGTVR